MKLVPPKIEERLSQAVAHYWSTLDRQAERQTKGSADRGRRAAVTGGRQMDGFKELVKWWLLEMQVPEESILLKSQIDVPGFFRPEKEWDLLVVEKREGVTKRLIAAIEFKSQRGPSFGNNFNNRAEEAIGIAKDFWTAHREGAFGIDKPWLGLIMLLDDCEGSRHPVGVHEPHFKVFPEFRGSSYAKRYELLLRKLVLEKLFDRTALVLSTEEAGRRGEYHEPADDLTVKKFLQDLARSSIGFIDPEVQS